MNVMYVCNVCNVCMYVSMYVMYVCMLSKLEKALKGFSREGSKMLRILLRAVLLRNQILVRTFLGVFFRSKFGSDVFTCFFCANQIWLGMFY